MCRKPYFQLRCNVQPMVETMHILKDSHLKLLMRTPFWPLLEAFLNGTISKSHFQSYTGVVIKFIQQVYDAEKASFQFGSRDVAISTRDISQILGLPDHGEAVLLMHAGPSRSYISDFTWRHFLRDSRPRNRKLIHSKLMIILNENEQTDIEDVVRLTLMELFITFLFPQKVISWDLMKYCENFENVSRYSWAEAVGEFLKTSLKVQSNYDIFGCALLIPFWLCEKTNLIPPISGREVVEGHIPRLIKWSLRELGIKMKQLNFSAIQPFFKEQDAIKAGFPGENEIQEHKEGDVNSDEKVDTMGRGSVKHLREEVVEKRTKLRNNNGKFDVKNNLEKGDRQTEITKDDQLNFQSSSAVFLSTRRHKTEVFEVSHEMGTTMTTGKQLLDTKYACDVGPNNEKERKQQALSSPITPISGVSSRPVDVPNCKKDQNIVILEESSSEKEERPRKRKCSRKNSFRPERHEVFKLMDDEHQQKVKAFWNKAGSSRELFWNGINASVTCEDVEKLIKDTAVSTNLIDGYMELLEQQSSAKRWTYISTLCWYHLQNYVETEDARNKGKKGKIYQAQDEARDIMGLNQLVFDPLLRSIGNLDYVFIPIISRFHYSLLILNKNEKKWTHFNPLRKRSGLHIDPGYELAKKMHLMIQKWLHSTQREAPTMLLKGTKRKMTSRNPETWADEPLSEDEKRSLKWMVDQNIDFTLENDLKCPQQDFKSLDCGIFIMYYMTQLSQGLPVEESVSRCRMWEFRKDLIERFADHESSWKQN